MDRIDAKLLNQLSRDGRISWSRLAGEVNLSASACQRRVEALIERGVIENFTVNLNDAALGHPITAFVAVNVDRQSTELAEAFRDRVRMLPQVQACYMISGAMDFMLEVVAPDLDAFGSFIEKKILSLPAVKDASSSFVLKVVKPKTTLIEDR